MFLLKKMQHNNNTSDEGYLLITKSKRTLPFVSCRILVVECFSVTDFIPDYLRAVLGSLCSLLFFTMPIFSSFRPCLAGLFFFLAGLFFFLVGRKVHWHWGPNNDWNQSTFADFRQPAFCRIQVVKCFFVNDSILMNAPKESLAALP